MRSIIRFAPIVAAAGLLVACGGAGPTAGGIGSGGTGGISSGPITGFGSVVVNGVKFDDTGARVTIDGVPDRPVSELKLGLVVDVHGVVDADKTGKADSIVATHAALGPVATVDASGGSLQVLGQRVRVDASTVFDGFTALSAIGTGDIIAMSGLKDAAAGAFVATRIERRPPPSGSPSPVQVQGTIAGITGMTFRLEGLAVAYASAQIIGIPAGGLTNGLAVTVTGAQPPVGSVLTAATIRVQATALPRGTNVEYVGYIAHFVSPANFQVGSFTVDATGARIVGGTLANLADGARVEIEGTASGNVVVASQVTLFAPAAETQAQVEGPITDFISASNFRVRGQLIHAAGAAFAGGTAANLANGRVVHIAGFLRASVLEAATVEFKDTTPPEATRLAVDGQVTEFFTPSRFKVNGRAVATSATTVFYGGSSGDLANGRRVAAEGTVSGGVLDAATLRIYPQEPAPAVSTEGPIANYVSPASFMVNGQAVSAGPGTAYVSGTSANLANGVTVKVTGPLVSGVLQAASVEFKARVGDGSKSEVEGYITQFVSASNFKVNGQVVDASAARYEHGTAADLANGLKVHATGTISSGVLRAALLQIDR
jgi:hypothetical protein